MYIWNIHALARDLKENKVSVKEQVRYLESFLGSLIVLYLLRIDFGRICTSTDRDLLILIIGPIILWGINHVYLINQDGDQKDFFGRFFSLGAVAFNRFWALLLLGIFLTGGIQNLLGWVLEFIANALQLSPEYHGRLVHQGADIAFYVGLILIIIMPIFSFLYLVKKCGMLRELQNLHK